MISTLLGPERTTCVASEGEGVGVVVSVTVQAWPGLAYRVGEPALWLWGCVPGGLVWDLWVVGWLLVENCTVDASIFVFCRVKLSRANGGCLGTRSR